MKTISKTALFTILSILALLIAGCASETATVPSGDIAPIESGETAAPNEPVSSSAKKECVVDSDCQGAGQPVADGYRCWQKTLYARFNETKCLAGKCSSISYESIAETCNLDLEICDSVNGKCSPRPVCFDRDGYDIYTAGQTKDNIGGLFNDTCVGNYSVREYYCNPNNPDQVLEEVRDCPAGCVYGRCNTEHPLPDNQITGDAAVDVVPEENISEENQTAV